MLGGAHALLIILQQFIVKVKSIVNEAVNRLKKDAPKDTGYMARVIEGKAGSGSVLFTINLPAGYTGFVVFGHRTRGGSGYVQGRDFVTPTYLWIIKEMKAALKML